MARRQKGQLSETDEHFALEYLNNGHNATRAYQTVHPKAKATSAATQGWKLLRKPEIDAFITKERTERYVRMQMGGDEALALISNLGRGSLRDFFKDNRLLPISEWPEEAIDRVKALKPGPFGTSIVLHDKLKARELMAVAGGKLKQAVDHTHKFDHAAYLGAEPPDGDDE